MEFDDQHCGIYAGDADSYVDFADVFTPIICEYHGLDESFKHTSDMDASKIKGNINPDAPVKSTRIRVGRSIEGICAPILKYFFFMSFFYFSWSIFLDIFGTIFWPSYSLAVKRSGRIIKSNFRCSG